MRPKPLINPHHDARSLVDTGSLSHWINYGFSSAIHLNGTLQRGWNHRVSMVQQGFEHTRQNAPGHFFLASFDLAGFLVIHVSGRDPKIGIFGFITKLLVMFNTSIWQLLHILLSNQFKECLQNLLTTSFQGCNGTTIISFHQQSHTSLQLFHQRTDKTPMLGIFTKTDDHLHRLLCKV